MLQTVYTDGVHIFIDTPSVFSVEFTSGVDAVFMATDKSSIPPVVETHVNIKIERAYSLETNNWQIITNFTDVVTGDVNNVFYRLDIEIP